MAVIDVGGGACEIDVAVLLAPLDVEGAAVHDDSGLAGCSLRHCSGYGGGTCAGPACHGDAAATFPHAHADAIGTNLSKLDVAAFGETGMMLKK